MKRCICSEKQLKLVSNLLPQDKTLQLAPSNGAAEVGLTLVAANSAGFTLNDHTTFKTGLPAPVKIFILCLKITIFHTNKNDRLVLK